MTTKSEIRAYLIKQNLNPKPHVVATPGETRKLVNITKHLEGIIC